MSHAWRVELVGVGAVAPALLRRLAQRLEGYLTYPVALAAATRDPVRAFDRARNQYNATVLLEDLLQPPPAGGTRRLGVTAGDLFLPVLTHVFGAAQLGGSVGVVSTHRLRPELADGATDGGRLLARLELELLHELGHTFGLVHCHRSWCAMAPSRVPEELDLKDPSYCESCAGVMGVPPNHWRTGGREVDADVGSEPATQRRQA